MGNCRGTEFESQITKNITSHGGEKERRGGRKEKREKKDTNKNKNGRIDMRWKPKRKEEKDTRNGSLLCDT